MMNTDVTVRMLGPRKESVSAVKAALNRMAEIAVKFNALDPGSPLYAFNHQGTPVDDVEIIGLIDQALQVSRASEGAFDITVAPLLEARGFYSPQPLPAGRDIKVILKSVGYGHLLFKNGQLVKDAPGVRINLGGIAKGYALIEAVKVLKARGVTSAMIDAGGDIYLVGKNRGRLWGIGIQDPRGAGIVGMVGVEDAAVMSSGDYERFFMQDGCRHHHIFNPATGHSTDGVASVTIIHADPVVAQAWGKVPFVLGAQRGLELIEKIPDMEAIVILSCGDKLYSRNIRPVLPLFNPHFNKKR